MISGYARLFPLAHLVMFAPILLYPAFRDPGDRVCGAVALPQIVPGMTARGLLMPREGGGIAWWAHIGGFAAGCWLAPLVRRSPRVYRRYFADEGDYGMLPNGRRFGRGDDRWV